MSGDAPRPPLTWKKVGKSQGGTGVRPTPRIKALVDAQRELAQRPKR